MSKLTSIANNKDFIVNGISAMPGGFFIYRADYDKEEILYANKALLKIFECETEEEFMELTGGTFKGLIHEEDYAIVEKSIKEQIDVSDKKFNEVTYRIKTRTGQIKFIEDFGSYVEDPDEGPLFYVFVSDPQNNIDPVSGLPNRKSFLQAVEKRLKEEDRGIPEIVAFDLNGMRGFNSKYGYKEGDRLLRVFGEVLRNLFGSNYCSRFGEDHFCAYWDQGGVEDVLGEVIDNFMNNRDGRTLPVKIGITRYEEDVPLYDLYERARIACQTQKNYYGSSLGYYDDSMAKDFARNEYILSHLDMALANGWIKVFLQPVVRTLTGQVCSGEALTRWIDPEIGFVSPGDFIPLLEKSGLSYKIDTYMIQKVAEILNNEIKEGRNPVPVSVNISRTDFLYCDPVAVVTEALDEYNLSRSLIRVEITESAFTDQPEAIQDAIERFHYEGIEVWMDDFGSGYSSLNVLKDFKFDEIKIDMVFLRNFDDKSRVIVTKAVQMAKELGIHTLAEGVESIEHVEFLRNIGCEKIQGYYYAKPMEYKEQMSNLHDLGFEFENNETASVYEKTGLINLATNRSRALFFYGNSLFNPIFLNENYIQTIAKTGLTSDEIIEKNMNSKKTRISKQFRDLAEKAIKSKNEEIMTLVVRDKYFHYSFRDVADSRSGSMLLATIDKSAFEDQETRRAMDDILRNISTAYDSIYLIDLENDTRTVIASGMPNESIGDVSVGLSDFYAHYNARDIYPEDYDRLQNYFRRENLEGIFNSSGKGIFADAVRMKDKHGNYAWIDFTVIPIPESEGQRFLLCVRPSVLEFRPDLAAMMSASDLDVGRNLMRDADLMRSMMRASDIKIFWKDKERRYVGASDAFISYYGNNTIDDFRGKTDEDLGWFLDDNFSISDEEKIINQGIPVRNAIGSTILEGVVHNILMTKFPVYSEGKISGIMGYLVDMDMDVESGDGTTNSMLIDPVTGLMNMQGQMHTLIELYDNYLKTGEDFADIAIEVKHFNDIIRDYGKDVAEDFIRLVGIKILNSYGKQAVIARVYGCSFDIAMRNVTREKIISLSEKCMEAINSIHEIDGRRCRIKASYGASFGSERDALQDIAELARLRMKGEWIPLSNS
ncbi:MAG: EAL domain-containing protein [Lachnospiraceae bacterium]|nr:EAL domain-containing protein [Lachnospiraceae bacterium]